MNLSNPYELCINRADHAQQIACGLETEAAKLEKEASEKRHEAAKWRAKYVEFLNAAEVLKASIEKVLVTPEGAA